MSNNMEGIDSKILLYLVKLERRLWKTNHYRAWAWVKDLIDSFIFLNHTGNIPTNKPKYVLWKDWKYRFYLQNKAKLEKHAKTKFKYRIVPFIQVQGEKI